MPASRFSKIVQETGQNSSAVSTCQFLLPGTTLYLEDHCTPAVSEAFVVMKKSTQKLPRGQLLRCGSGVARARSSIHVLVNFAESLDLEVRVSQSDCD